MKTCLSQKIVISSPFVFLPLFKTNNIFFVLFFSVLSLSVIAQQTVIGRVAAGDTAIVGATVQVKGTTNATQTNTEGRFSINAPGNGTLVFSSVGFAPQEVAINGRSAINIMMQPVNQQMNEVVVVGYGT